MQYLIFKNSIAIHKNYLEVRVEQGNRKSLAESHDSKETKTSKTQKQNYITTKGLSLIKFLLITRVIMCDNIHKPLEFNGNADNG